MESAFASQGTVLKALSEDKTAVVVTVELKEPLSELGQRLKAYPTALKHMGQGLLGAALIHALSDWDDDEKLELQWSVEGAFGHLYADSLGSGKLRCAVHKPQAEVYDFKVGLGSGLLQVRKTRKEPGLSSTGLVKATGFVAEDLVQYLQDSEQRSCGMHLNVKIEWDEEAEKRGDSPFKVVQAVGHLVHVLPQENSELKEQAIKLWEQRTQVMGPLSEWAIPENSEEAVNFMLELLTVGSRPTRGEPKSLKLYCTCSEERAQKAIALLSKDDRKELDDEVEITCEYCGTTYRVDVGEAG